MGAEINLPTRFVPAIMKAAFEGNCEAGAWLLFRTVLISSDPWTHKAREKLVLQDILPLTVRDIESSSHTHLTLRTESFVKLLKHAQLHNLVPGFLHGHPSGHAGFSQRDDENESALSKAAQNRNGDCTQFVSLLALPNGSMMARLWESPDNLSDIRVLTSGNTKRLLTCTINPAQKVSRLDRQARVFGDEFNEILGNLRVTVVGAGGTGSPLAIMLARSGIGKLAVIDPDIVEDTNLHRLHGATMKHVGQSKSEVLVSHIRSLGLEVDAVGFVGNIIEAKYRDLLKASDVIFCATDDHAGRMMLNRFAYFYETLVIDLGLAVEPAGNRPIRDMTGRVTLIYPGAPCLLCRNVVDPRRAREEELRRRSPDEYEKQEREGYMLGGGNPEPAFISMTTSVACMALEEFAQIVSSFRGNERIINQRLRRFQIPEDRCSGGISDEDCPICASREYWGIGDVTPFLDRVG